MNKLIFIDFNLTFLGYFLFFFILMLVWFGSLDNPHKSHLSRLIFLEYLSDFIDSQEKGH